jgi:hypothetical protein
MPIVHIVYSVRSISTLAKLTDRCCDIRASRNESFASREADMVNDRPPVKIERDTYVHIANGNTTHFGDLSRGRRVGIREREALGVEVGRVEVEESLKISRHTTLGGLGLCAVRLSNLG